MREGWEIKKLGEIVSFNRGLTYTKSDEVEFSNNCVLRSNNIELETMSLNLEDLKYIKKDFYINEEKKIKKNSILICMSNGSKQHIGKVAFIDKDYDYAYGGFMGLITPNPNVFPKFIYYLCLSPSYKLFLAGIGNGANITNIKFSDISKFSFLIPNYSIQEKIVEELDCLSGIIEKKKEQLKQLDALAQSIFYEMFGNPIENEKGWEVKKLGDVCNIYGRIGFRGYTTKDLVSNPNEGAISLSPSNIINGHLDYSKCTYISWFKYEESPEIKIYNGDILLVKTGSSYGKCALVRDLPHKATINPQYVVLKDIEINNIFLTICLQSSPIKEELDIFTIGAAIPTFSQKNLGNMNIAIPPLSLQQEFASKIELIDKQKELIKQSIKETETLFNSRMDYYFN